MKSELFWDAEQGVHFRIVCNKQGFQLRRYVTPTMWAAEYTIDPPGGDRVYAGFLGSLDESTEATIQKHFEEWKEGFKK